MYNKVICIFFQIPFHYRYFQDIEYNSLCAKSLQLYLTFCDPMNGSLSGSVHGIFQERTLGGLQFSHPGNLPDPGIKPTSPVSPAESLLAES